MSLSKAIRKLMDVAAMGEMFKSSSGVDADLLAKSVADNTIYLPADELKPPPKGCKEYFFDVNGEFSNESMHRSEMVFKCVASNDKNAKRKFKNSQNKKSC